MGLVDETAPQGFDLPRLIAAVSERKFWVLAPTLAAFIAAGAFVTLVKPRFTATAKVMLENGESYFTRPEKALPDAPGVVDELAVESEVEAAKSPDVVRRALESLSPSDQAEFKGAGGLLSSLGGRVYGGPDERRLEAFAANVNVFAQAKTRVLLFEFTSQDREAAARGANKLADAFLDSQRDLKDNEARSASKWLSEQIDALRARVAAAEGRVEALRAKSGLLAGPNGLAVPSQQLSEISAQIATARAAEAAANAKAGALRNLVRGGRLDEVVSVANDESIRRYADSRVAVKAQISELGRTLLPGHPRMKELNGQLAGLDQEIRNAALKRVRGYEEDARIAEAQVRSLKAATADQAKAVTSNDEDEAKLRELEIDAKTARDQLESYLTKYREAIAREAANASPANGHVIARAVPPGAPSFPKAGSILLLAPVAAFFISLGLIVARILLLAPPPAAVAARREPTPEMARTPFGIDPAPPVRAPRVEAADGGVDLTPWMEGVAAFVDRLADASEGERLALMAAGQGESGALSIALTAARRLARRGSAVLVDLGPSPSWLQDVFDRARSLGPTTTGLSDLIAGVADFSHAAHRDLSVPLDIVPSGLGAVDPSGMAEVLEAMQAHYDFVVVHAQDWRDPCARRALEEMVALIVAAAPGEEGAETMARVRAGLADEQLAIKVVGAGAGKPRREQAA